MSKSLSGRRPRRTTRRGAGKRRVVKRSYRGKSKTKRRYAPKARTRKAPVKRRYVAKSYVPKLPGNRRGLVKRKYGYRDKRSFAYNEVNLPSRRWRAKVDSATVVNVAPQLRGSLRTGSSAASTSQAMAVADATPDQMSGRKRDTGYKRVEAAITYATNKLGDYVNSPQGQEVIRRASIMAGNMALKLAFPAIDNEVHDAISAIENADSEL